MKKLNRLALIGSVFVCFGFASLLQAQTAVIAPASTTAGAFETFEYSVEVAPEDSASILTIENPFGADRQSRIILTEVTIDGSDYALRRGNSLNLNMPPDGADYVAWYYDPDQSTLRIGAPEKTITETINFEFVQSMPLRPVSGQYNGVYTPNQEDEAEVLPSDDVTVEVTPASLESITITSPQNQVTAGESIAEVEITVWDTYGNIKTNFLGEIVFSRESEQDEIPNPYRFDAEDLGSHTFENAFSLTVAGVGRINAAVRDEEVEADRLFRVDPAHCDSYTFTATPAALETGDTLTLRVTNALDAYGNAVSGRVTVTAGGYEEQLSPNGTRSTIQSIAVEGGAGQALQRLVVPGEVTLTGAFISGEATIERTSQVEVQSHDEGAGLQYVSEFNDVLTAGDSLKAVQVQIIDAFGNTATRVEGSVSFTSSDGGAVFSSNTGEFADGEALLDWIQFRTAGTRRLTAEFEQGEDVLQVVSPPIQVSANLCDSYTFTATPAALETGDTLTLRVTNALDAYGNAVSGRVTVTAGGYEEQLSPNGTRSTIQSIAVEGGAGQALQRLVVPGEVTITASFEFAEGSLDRTVDVTVSPGDFTNIQIDEEVLPDAAIAGDVARRIQLSVTDRFGNLKTDYSGELECVMEGVVADLSNPTLLFEGAAAAVIDSISFREQGLCRLVVTGDDGNIRSGSRWIRVSPNVCAQILIDDLPATVRAGHSTTLRVFGVRDAYDNDLTGNISVSIDGAVASPSGSIPTVPDLAVRNGAGEIRFILINSGAGERECVITLIYQDEAAASAEENISVIPGGLARFDVSGTPLAVHAWVSWGGLTAVAYDSLGNVKTDYLSDVSVFSTDEEFQAPDAGELTFNDGSSDGMRQWDDPGSFMFHNRGLQRITVTDADDNRLRGVSPEVRVTDVYLAGIADDRQAPGRCYVGQTMTLSLIVVNNRDSRILVTSADINSQPRNGFNLIPQFDLEEGISLAPGENSDLFSFDVSFDVKGDFILNGALGYNVDGQDFSVDSVDVALDMQVEAYVYLAGIADDRQAPGRCYVGQRLTLALVVVNNRDSDILVTSADINSQPRNGFNLIPQFDLEEGISLAPGENSDLFSFDVSFDVAGDHVLNGAIGYNFDGQDFSVDSVDEALDMRVEAARSIDLDATFVSPDRISSGETYPYEAVLRLLGDADYVLNRNTTLQIGDSLLTLSQEVVIADETPSQLDFGEHHLELEPGVYAVAITPRGRIYDQSFELESQVIDSIVVESPGELVITAVSPSRITTREQVQFEVELENRGGAEAVVLAGAVFTLRDGQGRRFTTRTDQDAAITGGGSGTLIFDLGTIPDQFDFGQLQPAVSFDWIANGNHHSSSPPAPSIRILRPAHAIISDMASDLPHFPYVNLSQSFTVAFTVSNSGEDTLEVVEVSLLTDAEGGAEIGEPDVNGFRLEPAESQVVTYEVSAADQVSVETLTPSFVTTASSLGPFERTIVDNQALRIESQTPARLSISFTTVPPEILAVDNVFDLVATVENSGMASYDEGRIELTGYEENFELVDSEAGQQFDMNSSLARWSLRATDPTGEDESVTLAATITETPTDLNIASTCELEAGEVERAVIITEQTALRIQSAVVMAGERSRTTLSTGHSYTLDIETEFFGRVAGDSAALLITSPQGYRFAERRVVVRRATPPFSIQFNAPADARPEEQPIELQLVGREIFTDNSISTRQDVVVDEVIPAANLSLVASVTQPVGSQDRIVSTDDTLLVELIITNEGAAAAEGSGHVDLILPQGYILVGEPEDDFETLNQQESAALRWVVSTPHVRDLEPSRIRFVGDLENWLADENSGALAFGSSSEDMYVLTVNKTDLLLECVEGDIAVAPVLSVGDTTRIGVAVRNRGEAGLRAAPGLRVGLAVEAGLQILGSAVQDAGLNDVVRWRIRCVEAQAEPWTWTASIDQTPFDENSDATASVSRAATSGGIEVTDSTGARITSLLITSPEGAVDSTLSTDQHFTVTVGWELSGLFIDDRAVLRLGLPEDYSAALGEDAQWVLASDAGGGAASGEVAVELIAPPAAGGAADLTFIIEGFNRQGRERRLATQMLTIQEVIQAARLLTSGSIQAPAGAVDNIVTTGQDGIIVAFAVDNIGDAGLHEEHNEVTYELIFPEGWEAEALVEDVALVGGLNHSNSTVSLKRDIRSLPRHRAARRNTILRDDTLEGTLLVGNTVRFMLTAPDEIRSNDRIIFRIDPIAVDENKYDEALSEDWIEVESAEYTIPFTVVARNRLSIDLMPPTQNRYTAGDTITVKWRILETQSAADVDAASFAKMSLPEGLRFFEPDSNTWTYRITPADLGQIKTTLLVTDKVFSPDTLRFHLLDTDVRDVNYCEVTIDNAIHTWVLEGEPTPHIELSDFKFGLKQGDDVQAYNISWGQEFYAQVAATASGALCDGIEFSLLMADTSFAVLDSTVKYRLRDFDGKVRWKIRAPDAPTNNVTFQVAALGIDRNNSRKAIWTTQASPTMEAMNETWFTVRIVGPDGSLDSSVTRDAPVEFGFVAGALTGFGTDKLTGTQLTIEVSAAGAALTPNTYPLAITKTGSANSDTTGSTLVSITFQSVFSGPLTFRIVDRPTDKLTGQKIKFSNEIAVLPRFRCADPPLIELVSGSLRIENPGSGAKDRMASLDVMIEEGQSGAYVLKNNTSTYLELGDGSDSRKGYLVLPESKPEGLSRDGAVWESYAVKVVPGLAQTLAFHFEELPSLSNLGSSQSFEPRLQLGYLDENQADEDWWLTEPPSTIEPAPTDTTVVEEIILIPNLPPVITAVSPRASEAKPYEFNGNFKASAFISDVVSHPRWAYDGISAAVIEVIRNDSLLDKAEWRGEYRSISRGDTSIIKELWLNSLVPDEIDTALQVPEVNFEATINAGLLNTDLTHILIRAVDRTCLETVWSIPVKKLPFSENQPPPEEKLVEAMNIRTAPNPYRYNPNDRASGRVKFEFGLLVPGLADIAIYDVSGELVQHWNSDELGGVISGPREFWWNGLRSGNREELSNGVYFVLLTFKPTSGGVYKSAWKMAVLRGE